MNFRVDIVTRMERNAAIGLVRNAIIAAEGWVTHHQLFSNMAVSISCEMPMGLAAKFIAALHAADLAPAFDGDIPKDDGGKDVDLRVGITLTFIHNEPDLKRDVPAFG